MAKKPKPVMPATDRREDVRAAELRNKGVGRIGNTPLAEAGVVRRVAGEGLRVQGLESGVKSPNVFAPGKSFASNLASALKNRKSDPGYVSPTVNARENIRMYGASLPGKRKPAMMNALAMAKAKKGGK